MWIAIPKYAAVTRLVPDKGPPMLRVKFKKTFFSPLAICNIPMSIFFKSEGHMLNLRNDVCNIFNNFIHVDRLHVTCQFCRIGHVVLSN